MLGTNADDGDVQANSSPSDDDTDSENDDEEEKIGDDEVCPYCAAAPTQPGAGVQHKCWAYDHNQIEDWLNPADDAVADANKRLSKSWYYQQIPIPTTFDGCTGRQKRLVIYYQIYKDCFPDGCGERVVLPLCVIGTVRAKYPDDEIDKLIQDAKDKPDEWFIDAIKARNGDDNNQNASNNDGAGYINPYDQYVNAHAFGMPFDMMAYL